MSQDEKEAAPEKAKRPKRKAVLAGAAFVLVVLVAVGLRFAGLPPFGQAKPTLPPKGQASAAPPALVEIPEVITNLDAGPHRISFAKFQYRIEVERGGDASLVKAALPQIVDMTETYLRAVRPEELRTPEGTYLLREAILDRLSTVLPTVPLGGIFFEELIVQ